jgi:hypothetical protein
VTDAMLPSDNEWGIPCLDPALQAVDIPQPVLHWGSRQRGARHTGTWSFYVDDYRFEAVLSDVAPVVRTGCAAACELNLTLRDHAPRALVIAATYRKRRVAALLQARLISTFVDLCVPAETRPWSMLGVPRGWRAFSTRGYAARPAEVRDEYAFAEQWAGRQPLLLVVGGGESIRSVCSELPGAVWCPGHKPKVMRDG